MDERDQYHKEKLGLEVELEPEIARLIRNSGHVSTMKGRSAEMLKVGVKRKRTKAEMDAAKLEQETREQFKQEQATIIHQLQ